MARLHWLDFVLCHPVERWEAPPRAGSAVETQQGSSWGGAMRMSSLRKNGTIGKLNLSREIHLVDKIMFYNIVQIWKIQLPSSLFHPCPVGAPSGLHPMFQLSATASPRSMWLGLTFTDRGEPRHSSFFGCLKALETGGALEITHNKPASFMGEECWGADLVELLDPPLERFEHDLREWSFKAAQLALLALRSYVFSYIYLSFIIHPSFVHPYPKCHGDNWCQQFQGPSFLKDIIWVGWGHPFPSLNSCLAWSIPKIRDLQNNVPTKCLK